jgi:hypothetical protein
MARASGRSAIQWVAHTGRNHELRTRAAADDDIGARDVSRVGSGKKCDNGALILGLADEP